MSLEVIYVTRHGVSTHTQLPLSILTHLQLPLLISLTAR